LIKIRAFSPEEHKATQNQEKHISDWEKSYDSAAKSVSLGAEKNVAPVIKAQLGISLPGNYWISDACF